MKERESVQNVWCDSIDDELELVDDVDYFVVDENENGEDDMDCVFLDHQYLEHHKKRGKATRPKLENQQATSSMPIQTTEEDHVATGPSAVDLKETLEKQYHKIKEHAETYPYVWASYIVVYGGFCLWTAYRWRKLRKTEDRVRTLQERLRKLVEAEESATSTTVVEKGPASSEKPAK